MLVAPSSCRILLCTTQKQSRKSLRTRSAIWNPQSHSRRTPFISRGYREEETERIQSELLLKFSRLFSLSLRPNSSSQGTWKSFLLSWPFLSCTSSSPSSSSLAFCAIFSSSSSSQRDCLCCKGKEACYNQKGSRKVKRFVHTFAVNCIKKKILVLAFLGFNGELKWNFCCSS